MLNFILGAVVMWGIVGIALVVMVNITREEDKTILVCGGPLVWLWCSAIAISDKARRRYKDKNYKALIVCPDDQIRWCRSRNLEYFGALTGYKHVKTEALKEYIHFWNEDKFASSMCIDKKTPNIRYAPPKVWKNFESVNEYIKKIEKGEE